MKKPRKFVRDAKGRFAEVPGSAPSPAKYFSEFSIEDQGAITKQLKGDRAKARREKAKLLAGKPAVAAPANPHSTVKPGAPWPKLPGLENEPAAFKSTPSSPLLDAQDALTKARKSGDPAAIKRARARVRREKAKAEAENAGQTVTMPEEVKAQEAKAPKKPKGVGATPAQKAAANQKRMAADQQIAASRKRLAEIKNQLSHKYGAAGYLPWNEQVKLHNERDAEQLKIKKAEVQKAEARQSIAPKPTTPEAQAKANLAEIILKQKQNDVRLKANLAMAYDPATYDARQAERKEVEKEKNELALAKAEAQNQIDVARGIDPNDATDWMAPRKMATAIAAQSTRYNAEDGEFRSKVASTWNSTRLAPNKVKAHQDYTHATYRHMNGALRKGPPYPVVVGDGYIDNYWKDKGGLPVLIDTLSDTINEDGNEVAVSTTVMRGIRGNASYHPAEVYVEGAVIEEKAFTSVTVSKKIQSSFSKPRGFKGDNESWSIYARLPQGTKYLHGNRAESEMILDKGTKFKVLKVDKVKNQIFLVRVD